MTIVDSYQPPSEILQSGRYRLQFAQSEEDLNDLFRLRYDVFNVELNEGLDASHTTGMDADAFDAQCHHLMVRDGTDGECIGTYRLQTFDMASKALGFYSATEFDLRDIPDGILGLSVEAGRACIGQQHRTLNVLHLLWKGLGIYMAHNRMRYLFGCCSLTSQEPAEGLAVLKYLEDHKHMIQGWNTQPLPPNVCEVTDPELVSRVRVKIPRLMRAYLSQGAQICGPPAIDTEFKTIDFLALLDVEKLSSMDRAYYGVER